MSPIPVKCAKCGKTVQAPESKSGKEVKCPNCDESIPVPETGQAPARRPAPKGPLQLTCKDCGKTFNVPAWEKGQVVECPSCASWVRVGEKSSSLLHQQVPMPFQVSSSTLRWLRFLAGFNFLVGLAATVWVAVFFSTHLEESRRIVETSDKVRVINPEGILLVLATAAWAIGGTVILMALYWILQNVTYIHYTISRGESETK